MDAQAVPEKRELDSRTANDRLKESFEGWLWGSLVAATVVHFALFALWPTMTAADMGVPDRETEVVPLQPDIDIPEPPTDIARPAEPVATDLQVDEDVTIPPTTFDQNPVTTLPPPRMDRGAAGDSADTPGITPFTVAPVLRNREAMGRELERRYPVVLKEAGVGGTVDVHVYVDVEGRVQRVLVKTSSGFQQLDEAALAVARTMEFTPALNLDKTVAVWISVPVKFKVR